MGDQKWPQLRAYGYYRAVTIAYLVGALALLLLGGWLLVESAKLLLKAEHPTIGTVQLFGHSSSAV